MGRKTLYSLLVLFAVAAASGIGLAFDQHAKFHQQFSFDERRIALLEAENQRLRQVAAEGEKARAQAGNIVQRAQIERQVSEIRELQFPHPVTYDVLTRAEIKKVLEQKIGEQFSDEEIKNQALGLAALGLLPRDYPLKQKYIELLGEQVAAFYDQHQHKLFMFEDATLANSQNRIILAHELTHALQDQNFGLLKLPLEIKNNDDRAAAASALIEGDATLVMSQFMVQNISLKTLRDTLGGAMTQNMEQLQHAPRYLREMLIFPYLRGQEFCAALLAQGGWPALDAAYKNPPSSTSQILHPEKYLAEPREEPVRIDFGSDLTVNGEKPLADNVLGEMGIRIMLSEYIDAKKAERVASGWRGDRYLVYDNGNVLVWKTSWTNAQGARGFFEAAISFLISHYTLPAARHSDSMLMILSPRFIWLQCVGANEVVLIYAKDPRWGGALVEKFLDMRGI